MTKKKYEVTVRTRMTIVVSVLASDAQNAKTKAEDYVFHALDNRFNRRGLITGTIRATKAVAARKP